MAGQKETDIFDEGPVTTSQQQQQQPAPGMGKFMESSPAVASQEEADESVESRISRDPVAHAIVSPAKTERIHDSLADIYLTGIATNLEPINLRWRQHRGRKKEPFLKKCFVNDFLTPGVVNLLCAHGLN